MRNSQPISTVDSGYEGTTANCCIYLLGILHIFRPQNYRFLQHIADEPELQICLIVSVQNFATQKYRYCKRI
jgi:hypothetical protein